jgi:hypothetical protein
MACASCEEYMNRIKSLRPPTLEELLRKQYIQNCDGCDAFCKEEFRKTGNYPRKSCDRMAHYAQHGRFLLDRQVKRARATGLNLIASGHLDPHMISILGGSIMPEHPITKPVLLPNAPTTPLPDLSSLVITPPKPSTTMVQIPVKPPTKPLARRTARMQLLLDFIRLNQDNGIPFPQKPLGEFDLCKYVHWYIKRLEALGINLNYRVPSITKKKK